MKKKLMLLTLGLVSVVTLAACSSDKSIVTMKGGKITQDEFYTKIKNGEESKNQLYQMIMTKVLDQSYGDKVSKDTVNKRLSEEKNNYGEEFEAVLDYYKITEAEFKENIKMTLLVETAVKDHTKVTDKKLKDVWATFHPEVEVEWIVTAEEKDAKDTLAKLKDKGDFAKLAKEKSIDTQSNENGGKFKFDSQNMQVPKDVQDKVFKMKKGELSEVIPGEAGNFYIVKMVNNPGKGDDMKPYKKELTEILYANQTADEAFMKKMYTEELTKADVKIEDEELQSVLASFFPEKEEKEKTDNSGKKEDKNKSEDKKEDKKETKDSDKK